MRSTVGILAIGLGLVGCGVDYGDPGTDPVAPRATWYQDVAPILSQRCMGCHQPGGIAPFSLMDPETTKENAKTMLVQTDAGAMPPFSAKEEAGCTPRFGWIDDPRLTTSEKATLHAWVEDGMADGEVAPVAAPPSTDLPDVSTTLKPATPWTSSGDRDQFICTILDPKTTQLQWMTGLQVHPGNATVVHHVVITELDAGADQDTLVAANGIGAPFDCSQITVPGSFVMSIWTPGNQPMQTPSELAVPIGAGAKVVMQIHYHPAGRLNDPDATSIDLRFSQVWPSKMYFVAAFGNAQAAPQLLPDPDDPASGPVFTVPANKADHIENMSFTMPDLTSLGQVRLFSVNPHMHLIGTHIESTITRVSPPASQPAQECLANGGWNFDWQRTYIYNVPLDQAPLVSTGDTINIKCHWDNTMENPFEQRLLHDANLVAPIDVTLGEQTTNEMCLEIFGIAVDAPAQPTGRQAPQSVRVPHLGSMSALR